MSLLTTCQTALRESGQFTVPSTIVGNADPTAVQLLALANRAGRTLARENWQVLLTSYTFATVVSTASYALPSDFGNFANLTFWDRTNYWAIKGPVTAMEWQTRKSASIASVSGVNKAFRIAGGLFYIDPTPSAVETIAYDYFSTYWITGKDGYSDDADVALIDEDLIVLGLKWRWLQAKGDSFENEKAEYTEALNSALAVDGAKDAIRFSDATRPRVLGGNLPETNFGV